MSKWLMIFVLGTLFVAQGWAMGWEPNRSEISAGNNELGFDLYRVVADDNDDNIFFSPYSISQAGAMLYGGARHNTATQMADTFYFTQSTNELAASFAAVNDSLSQQGQDLSPDMAEGKFQLNIVNGVWAQQGYPFSTAYLVMLQDIFESELREVNFETDARSAHRDINNWISEQTAERLQDVVPEPVINQSTRMVLVNAIYFNALWQFPFVENGTYTADFTLLDDSTTTVSMMLSPAVHHNYVAGDNYTAVAMPYLGSSIEMVVIVPEDLAEFEAALDAKRFSEIRQSMQWTYLDVEMPRFEFKSDIPLKIALQELGMLDAFVADQADFTGMLSENATNSLYVSDAIHSAFVSVDENGTEAAAVTVFAVAETSAPVDSPTLFRADHPFVLVIYDTETDLILFLGRVTNPNQ